MAFHHLYGALIAVAAMIGTADAAEWSRWYVSKAPEPRGSRVHICHSFGCTKVSRVTFSQKDLAVIAGPLGKGTRSAPEERAALSGAVQRYEQLVGSRIGTSADLPGIQGWGRSDQMDCIDEATNTASLLILLSSHGYLRFHEVRSPTSRGFFLDGRYPHSTAVMAERGGEEWSVDSWPRANGEAPVIMPMREWRRQRTSSLQ